MRIVVSGVALAVATACFHPSYDSPACSAAGECPDGYHCDDQQVCQRGAAGDEPPPIVLELLAGSVGGHGNVDGTAGPGGTARFDLPRGVAVDTAGNVYVSDHGNGSIRKITPAGVVTTLAGARATGSADGTGSAARFNGLERIAAGGGVLYVADWGNHLVRKVTLAGAVTTLAGSAGMPGGANGTGSGAQFNFPSAVAVDGLTNLYVADTSNSSIRRVTSLGSVTTLAGTAGMPGNTDATGAAARFSSPVGLAVDGGGANIYVADTGNNTIRKVTTAGVVTTLAGSAGMSGSDDGTGDAARFNYPAGMAIDGAGNLYVADFASATIRKVTTAGVVTTLAGTAGAPGSVDGTGAAARFNGPLGVAVDGAGNVLVTEDVNSVVRKITPSGVVTTLAGVAAATGSADGTGAAAHFDTPSGVAVDAIGDQYVADTGNHTIRKVSSGGLVTTLAGTAGIAGSVDGVGAAARFNAPSALAIDDAGNLYVTDTGNHTVRRVTPGGGVTTLAGAAGMVGSTDGTRTAARFNGPTGVAVDRAGNLFVCDTGNQVIRKIAPDGAVTTPAGAAGAPGTADGTGPAARFRDPVGVAVDGAGTLYVVERLSSTIRRIANGAVVTTLAGAPAQYGSFDGTRTSARFFLPGGVAVDEAGNVYVADTANSAIRKVTPAGVTTTVAGTAGQAGILVGAAPRLASPRSVAVRGDSIVIADTDGILLLRHGAR